MEDDEKRDLSMTAVDLRSWVPLIIGPVATDGRVCVSGARGSLNRHRNNHKYWPATESLSII